MKKLFPFLIIIMFISAVFILNAQSVKKTKGSSMDGNNKIGYKKSIPITETNKRVKQSGVKKIFTNKGKYKILGDKKVNHSRNLDKEIGKTIPEREQLLSQRNGAIAKLKDQELIQGDNRSEKKISDLKLLITHLETKITNLK